jgi:signal transduction histidine kinase
MTPRRRLRDPLPWLAVLIALLLSGLAVLQHRWLQAVSVAERARMKADASARAVALAHDLDRELTRAFLMLGAEGDGGSAGDFSGYPAAFRAWKERATYPDLVEDVWIVGVEPPRGRIWRFDPKSNRVEAAAVPPDLAALFARLAAQGAHSPAEIDSIDPLVPALVLSAPHRGPLPEDGPQAAPDHFVMLRADLAPMTWTVVRLDRRALAERILPDLTRRHASTGDAAEYRVTVFGPRPGQAEPGVVWQSDPAAPRQEAGADASARALAVRFDDIDSAILSKLLPGPTLPLPDVAWAGDSGTPPHAGPRRVFAFRLAARAGLPSSRAPWTIAFFHRAGSVDAAVAGAERRSGLVAGAVLLLLAGSAALVIASARRERRLAARQLEFVAAVSHELRTPLTVIRSAAENLRDGVVVEPVRVREYGALLRDEGRRLTEMVEQVLAFAGADAAGPERRRPIEVERMVRAALGEAGLEEAGLEVRVEVEPGLRVLGEEAALAAALRNLLANLKKYAAGGGLARVAARRTGSTVEIVVEDRGPGLAADEIRRVFEPFFRGRCATESQAPGSGIGLALVRRIVEAHGGDVEARALARGTAFVIHLPAAPAAETAGLGAPAPERAR